MTCSIEFPCWIIDYQDYCRIVRENNENDPDFWVREALCNHVLSVEKLENQEIYLFRILNHRSVISEGTEKDVMVKLPYGIRIFDFIDFRNTFELITR